MAASILINGVVFRKSLGEKYCIVARLRLQGAALGLRAVLLNTTRLLVIYNRVETAHWRRPTLWMMGRRARSARRRDRALAFQWFTRRGRLPRGELNQRIVA